MNQDDYDKLLAEAKKDDKRYEGYTPMTYEENGKLKTKLVPNRRTKAGESPHWQDTLTQATVPADWGVDAPQKRTEIQRVESLTNKLWKAVQDHNPGEMEIVLKMLQAESWKRGDPVTYEDVKRLAITQMKKAAEDAKVKP